jgi:stage V sporulation protein G
VKVTDVKIFLARNSHPNFLCFCTIVLDDSILISGIRIIQREQGLFVAMPARKRTDKCHHCLGTNNMDAKYCSQCGRRLLPDRVPRFPDGRRNLYFDVVHPVNAECRSIVEQAVLEAYQKEVELSKTANYQPVQDIFLLEEGA